MNENTINADVTMGNATDALLAGRYRVVKQLGQGGMGSVWLAEDTQLDNRRVAVKMLPSALLSNPRAYQQLKAEAMLSFKLNHPNIVRTRSFEDNTGNPLIVADYIEGENFDSYLATKGKISEDDVNRLLLPVAQAVDYAHSVGVIHRDIKPSNVMVDNDGCAFILDFGIARQLDETMTLVTGKAGAGTLMYMSPEQLRGQKPSIAQDVYSLSAMMYECLVGHPPFYRGPIDYQIIHEDPVPLKSTSFLATSIMAGLSKIPERRPKCCVDLFAGFSEEKERMRKSLEKVTMLFRTANLQEDIEKAELEYAESLQNSDGVVPVEPKERRGVQSHNFVVGEIVDCWQHPASGHLMVLRIHDGHDYVQVVCGAKNCKVGMKTALAKVGAWLPPNSIFKEGLEVRKGEVRGEVSEGMVCCESDIGRCADRSTGIIEFPDELCPGVKVSAALEYVERKNVSYIESRSGYFLGEKDPDPEKAGPSMLVSRTKNTIPNFTIASFVDEERLIMHALLSPITKTVCKIDYSDCASTDDEAEYKASRLRTLLEREYKSSFYKISKSGCLDAWRMPTSCDDRTVEMEIKFQKETKDYDVSFSLEDRHYDALMESEQDVFYRQCCEESEKGSSDAQYQLAMCYELGTGTAESSADAIAWYRQAAGGGHIGAQEALTRLEAGKGG